MINLFALALNTSRHFAYQACGAEPVARIALADWEALLAVAEKQMPSFT